ncbi:MAG: DUF2071 domain-containing protein [Bacteriovorax sp.]|nr:DUF2071 domain-containing protein [Bacteriovorax sp.]
MNRKILLSFILLFAGIIHLVNPLVFFPIIPSFFSMKLEIIYITGILEIILAIGLLIPRLQHVSAFIITIYFIILIPVHIYISYYGIEILGIENHGLLWVRTLFQYVLILWAYSLQSNAWVIEQVWRHVFFIHYKIDPKLIESLVPYKLDLYEGEAVISVVPFFMERIRFPFLPAIPKISSLWELNLRTYVEVNGIKGIYFFTLETDSFLGNFIANNFFHLPYQFSKIKARIKNNHYEFCHNRAGLSFELGATIFTDEIKSSQFDLWATERYSLFTSYKGMTYQGIVNHEPWHLVSASIENLKNNFTQLAVPGSPVVCDVSYARYLKVRFIPFKNVGAIY